MKIGVLTSSRADYGIYQKLLAKLSKDNRFELVIIAFGMHLLKEHGCTVKNIEKDDFGTIHKVFGMPIGDSKLDIAKGYGNLIVNFSEYWNTNKYDCVVALGDRFEMSAAVQATIPFNIKIAHLHGGETTLGAIDNIYRHQISLVSNLHFVATTTFVKKLENLLGTQEKIFNVGSLSLDGFKTLQLPKWKTVTKQFNIPEQEFLLVTFHPETFHPEKNEDYSQVVYETLKEVSLDYHIVITMANADTMGSLYREVSKKLKDNYPDKFSLVESFGKKNYFAAMKASKFLVGNTSSGILEAASYGKFVLNVGNRQLGRLQSDNVINVDFNKTQIINAIKLIAKKGDFKGNNKYYKQNTANNIIQHLL